MAPSLTSYKLAKYLLNYAEERTESSEEHNLVASASAVKLTDQQLKAEILAIEKKLKQYHDPELMVFKRFKQAGDPNAHLRHAKATMLEEGHVYDKYLLGILREFCIVTIALLLRLDKMHSKQILCGSITPYNFIFNPRKKECEPCDLGIVLSDKNLVKAENKLHGNLIYMSVDLRDIDNNKFLAPELKQSMEVYELQRHLKNILFETESRGIMVSNINDLKKLLLDFHQKKVKYTNKSEIYSVGYTINLMLSHMLEKLARLGLTMGEPIIESVPEKFILEADALLPEEFANHHHERITELLNEIITYIYDLMQESIEKRDSLPISIEKFRSVLKRITAIMPDFLLEFEGPEAAEYEETLGVGEHDHINHSHIAHQPHESHDHGHGGGHDHVDHIHAEHIHIAHDHADGEHHEEHSEHEEHAAHDEHTDHHAEHEEHAVHQEHHEHVDHGGHDDHIEHHEHKDPTHGGFAGHIEHDHPHDDHDHDDHAHSHTHVHNHDDLPHTDSHGVEGHAVAHVAPHAHAATHGGEHAGEHAAHAAHGSDHKEHSADHKEHSDKEHADHKKPGKH